jgi:hypothetical protein
MWTIFRFALSGADRRAYEDAYAILKGAGFERPPAEASQPPCASAHQFPAAVLAYVRHDPAVVTRSIFEVLGEARLRPLGVTGAPLACAPEIAPRPRACA